MNILGLGIISMESKSLIKGIKKKKKDLIFPKTFGKLDPNLT